MNVEIDIPAIIKELIYTNNSVPVPGFGTFSSEVQTASLEVFEGVLSPPKKQLSFSEAVDNDDLLLLKAIQETNDVSHDKAVSELQKYVVELNRALRQKEIIYIKEVGRLYLDFENKVKFYPNNTNFNTSSYGLPELAVKQVIRGKDEQLIKKKQMETASFAKIKQESQEVSAHKTNNTIFGFAAAFFLVTVGMIVLVTLFANKSSNSSTSSRNSTQGKPIVVPQQEETDRSQTVDAAVNADNTNDEQTKQPEVVDTEAITPDVELKEGIIIIGGYGKKKNAQRMIQKIMSKGFEPFSDRSGNLNRVGVQFGYKTNTELDSMLQVIQKEIHPKAWILE